MPIKYRTALFLAAAANGLCAPASLGAEVDFGLAHQLFLVDHSGSMQKQYAWIGHAATGLKRHPGVSTRFGVMSFSENARPIAVGGKPFGPVADLNEALGNLKSEGAKEDGHQAVQQAVLDYKLSNRTAPHLVLVSDEHRSSVDPSVNASRLAESLAEAQIPLTVIVNVRFTCKDDRRAFGMNARGLGVLFDANGDLSTCTIGQLNEVNHASHSVTDYVDLALSTGGSAWDISLPRAGARGAKTFARVFGTVHGNAVAEQLSVEPTLPNVSYLPDSAKVGDVVTFDASASRATADGDALTGWSWDFNSDAVADTYGATVAHRFTTPGLHHVTLLLSTAATSRPVRHTFRVAVTE